MWVGYIYRHYIINKDKKEKSYVGQVQNREPEKRWRNGWGYISEEKEYNHFSRAIVKYGWDNFRHEILLTVKCETKEELKFWLDAWETYYIWYYDSYYNGYNSKKGPIDEEYRHETKQRMSEIKKGNTNRLKGIKKTKEHKEKISESLKGKYCGGSNHNARKVICLNTLQVFGCINEAKEWCKKGDVWACCKKRQTYAGKHPETGEKLKWMYYDEYLKLEEKDDNKNE